MRNGKNRNKIYTGFIIFAIVIGVLMIGKLMFRGSSRDDAPRTVDITEYP
jgi:hypothetical protein